MLQYEECSRVVNMKCARYNNGWQRANTHQWTSGEPLSLYLVEWFILENDFYREVCFLPEVRLEVREFTCIRFHSPVYSAVYSDSPSPHPEDSKTQRGTIIGQGSAWVSSPQFHPQQRAELARVVPPLPPPPQGASW